CKREQSGREQTLGSARGCWSGLRQGRAELHGGPYLALLCASWRSYEANARKLLGRALGHNGAPYQRTCSLFMLTPNQNPPLRKPLRKRGLAKQVFRCPATNQSTEMACLSNPCQMGVLKTPYFGRHENQGQPK